MNALPPTPPPDCKPDEDLAASFGRLIQRLYDMPGKAVWGSKAFDGKWLSGCFETALAHQYAEKAAKASGGAQRQNTFFRYPSFRSDKPTGAADEAIGVPALVADFDGGGWTVDCVLGALTLRPSFIIETSLGSFQAHLILDRPVDVGTARHFANHWNKLGCGADKASFNPVQAWRLPGSINWGDPAKVAQRPGAYPFVTRLAWSPLDAMPDDVDPMSVDVLLEMGWDTAPVSVAAVPAPFGGASTSKITTTAPQPNDASQRRNAERLTKILGLSKELDTPAFAVPDDRAVWIAVATGIKADCGEHGREFFHSWSALSKKYNEAEADETWDGLQPGGRKGVGELFKQARDNGFSISADGIAIGPGMFDGVVAMSGNVIQMTSPEDVAPLSQTDGPVGANSLPAPRLTLLRPGDFQAEIMTRGDNSFVEDLLYPGTTGFISGEWGTGKTAVAVALAVAVARGEPFAGNRVRAGRVLYLAAEDLEGVKGRIAAALRPGEDLNSRIGVASAAGLLADAVFHKPDQWVSDIQAAAIALGGPIDLIILDTLFAAGPGLDLNAMEVMTKLLSPLKVAAYVTQACIQVVHHHSKNPTTGMVGSVAAYTDAHTIIECRGKDKDSKTLHLKKNKRGPQDIDLATYVVDRELIGQTFWDGGPAGQSPKDIHAAVYRETAAFAISQGGRAPSASARPKPGSVGRSLSPHQQTALEALEAAVRTHGQIDPDDLRPPAAPIDEWRSEFQARFKPARKARKGGGASSSSSSSSSSSDAFRSAWADVRKKLVEGGFVETNRDENMYWINPNFPDGAALS